MYLTYFKREFAEKHGNSGVLARFVLFLAGIRLRKMLEGRPCGISKAFFGVLCDLWVAKRGV